MGRNVLEARDCLGKIFDALISSNCPLKEIKLDNNALGSEASVEVIRFFSNTKILLSLERIYLNDCGFAIKSAKAFASALNDAFESIYSQNLNEEIKIDTFEMSFNRMQDPGTIAICNVLATKLTTLKHITFSMCAIRDTGTAHVIKILHTNPIETMSIIDDVVEDEAAEELRCALLSAKNIRAINCSDCLMKGAKIACVFDGLIKTPSPITSLAFAGNELGDEHRDVLIEFLTSKKDSLRLLDVESNLLSEKVLVDLYGHVRRNYGRNTCFQLKSDAVDLSKFKIVHEMIDQIEILIEKGNDKPFIDAMNQCGMSVSEIIFLYIEEIKHCEDIVDVIDKIFFHSQTGNLCGYHIVEIINAIITHSISIFGFEFVDKFLDLCGLLKGEDNRKQNSDKSYALGYLINTINCHSESIPKSFILLIRDLVTYSRQNFNERIDGFDAMMKSISSLAL